MRERIHRSADDDLFRVRILFLGLPDEQEAPARSAGIQQPKQPQEQPPAPWEPSPVKMGPEFLGDWHDKALRRLMRAQ